MSAYVVVAVAAWVTLSFPVGVLIGRFIAGPEGRR